MYERGQPVCSTNALTAPSWLAPDANLHNVSAGDGWFIFIFLGILILQISKFCSVLFNLFLNISKFLLN